MTQNQKHHHDKQEKGYSFYVKCAISLFHNTHLLVLVLFIICLAGLQSFNNLPRIEDPNIVKRYPQITVLFPGASASRIEALVIKKIEDALMEIEEIKEVHSASKVGLAQFNIELGAEVGKGDNERVFADIQKQLDKVEPQLPVGASQPFLDSDFSAIAYSKIIAVSWTDDTPPQLGLMNRMAEMLADQMRLVSGSELVHVFGAPREEISVVLRSSQLAQIGISPATISNIIRNADVKLPAGAIHSKQRDLTVEVSGEIDSLERIRAIPLDIVGEGVTIGDIATVEKKWQAPVSEITYTQGKRSILVGVRTKDNIRLDQWQIKAQDVIDQFTQQYGGGLSIDTVFDQNHYTENRLASLGANLLAGALVVMFIILLGMGWRSAMVVGIALPLSAFLTLFGLGLYEQQLHQMSIFGMIIAIGLLIDNAIVVTDDMNKNLAKGLLPEQAINQTLSHLFSPLLASTLTTILGFMPVFLLKGAMGDFVGPIAIAVVLALIFSFFVSITIIPAVGAHGLSAKESAKKLNKTLRDNWVINTYHLLLTKVLVFPKISMLAIASLSVLGFMLASTLGQNFFPPADRNQFEVKVILSDSTAIEQTAKVAQQIEQAIKQHKSVKEVHWRIGGSFPTIYYNRIMDTQGNSAFAHGVVFTETLEETKHLVSTLPQLLEQQFPQAKIIVALFAQGPPIDAPIGFTLQGPDLNVLGDLGKQMRRIMHNVPGITNTSSSVKGGLAKVNFVVDEVAVRDAGLNLTQVTQQLKTTLDGLEGGALLDGLQELPVRVRLDAHEREEISDLEHALFMLAPSALEQTSNDTQPRKLMQNWLTLSDLGQFELVPQISTIQRFQGVRTNRVSGFIESDLLPIDITRAIYKRMEQVNFTLPKGYSLLTDGDSAEQDNALKDLTTYLPILLILMVATIILSFRSLGMASIVISVAVLSLGFGMMALWIGGYPRSFISIIGSVGLIGVAINGSIIVLAALCADERCKQGHIKAIIEVTTASTRHIISTTLTTIGGFLPLLLFTDGDFWPPLAIVIAGGVGLSIVLSLLFSPAAFLLMRRLYQRLGMTKVDASPVEIAPLEA